jgi:hypothetical protein
MGRSINGRNFDKVNPWTVASDADSSTVGQRQAEMIVDGIEKDKIFEINPTVSGWIGDYSGVNERRGQLSGPKTRDAVTGAQGRVLVLEPATAKELGSLVRERGLGKYCSSMACG